MTTAKEFQDDLNEHVLTAKEIAWFLKCDHRTVTNLLKSGKLHGFKLGREWRVQVKELKRYMGGQHE